MNTPEISIFLITYNQSKFVQQAVESILAQRLQVSWELVICDDSSTDGTAKLLSQLVEGNDRIRLCVNETNQGVTLNYHRALQACRGKYVASLEGDDYWIHPDKLQRQWEAMEANPDWVLVGGQTEQRFDSGEIRAQPPQPEILPMEKMFESGAMLHTSTMLFRREALPAIPTWAHEVLTTDWVVKCLLATQGKIGFLNEPLSVYRVHENGVWSTRNPSFQLQKQLISAQLMAENLPAPHDVTFQRKVRELYFRLFFAYREEEKIGRALLAYLLSAPWSQPKGFRAFVRAFIKPRTSD